MLVLSWWTLAMVPCADPEVSVAFALLGPRQSGLHIEFEREQGSTPRKPRRGMSANQVFALQLSYGPGDSGCSPNNLVRADFTFVDSSACSLGNPACVPVANTPQFGSLQKGSCVPSLQLALGFNQSYALVTQFGDAICGPLSATGGVAVPVGVCSPRMVSSALLSFSSPVKADFVSTNSVTGRLQYSTFADTSCSTTAISTVQFDTNNQACDQQRSIKLVTVSSSLQPQSLPPVNTASFSAPIIFASTTRSPAQSTNSAIIFSESNGPSLAFIIGVSAGGTVFLIILVSLAVFCFLRHRRPKQRPPSSSSLHRTILTENNESAPLISLTHTNPYGTRTAGPPSLPPVERASPIPERYSMLVGKTQNRSVVTGNTALSNQTELSGLTFYTTRSSEAEKDAATQLQQQQQQAAGVPLPKGHADSMETGEAVRPRSTIRAMPRNSVKFQLKVKDWSVDEVAEWVTSNDWPDETVKLVKDLGINGTDVLNLTDNDLLEGLLMASKEQRAVFLKEVDELRLRK
ncbi:hypothetical protein BC830DRAFT_1115780 [Chytriomyces sp. MP71]|nr:hypothetical protein BC830DRAFT_1115780 [Chytriomyces sp. MP71]